MPPAIAVTGAGIWCAAGTTPEQAFAACVVPRPGACWLAMGDRPVLACTAPDPVGCAGFPQARRMDRSVQLALAAALPAAAMARLDRFDPERVAVLVGNSRGPAGLWDLPQPPGRRVRPTRAAHTAVASISGALSLALHARGPCLTVSATCASAAHAIALGAGLLAARVVDAVVAGGAEAPLVRSLVEQFDAAGILGSHPRVDRACRPFDRTRNGTVPGEGAAFLVLERAGSDGTGAPPALAHLLGWAMTAESHNRVAARPDGDGLARALVQALAMAGLGPGDVGYINAHGTGTRVNDAAEAAALRSVFGPHLHSAAVTSTKPVTGHTFGAAAAIEAVLAIESLRTLQVPPTLGFAEPDPDLGLVPVAGRACPLGRPLAVSASLGFWGNAAALVLAPPPGRPPESASPIGQTPPAA